MTNQKRIEKGLFWDRAWSLVEGCSPVSTGCDHCWAAAQAHMRQNHPNEGIRKANSEITDDSGAFNGQVRFRRDLLAEPFRAKKPTTWAIWTDLFCEWYGCHEDRLLAFIVMSQCPQHTFLILTKRDRRMLNETEAFRRDHEMGNLAFPWPLPNVWVIVTAENQEQADTRIPHLLDAPLAHRGIIIEPMLEPVDADRGVFDRRKDIRHLVNGPACLNRNQADAMVGYPVDLVIAGPETGPRARPCEPNWIRSLYDQCRSPFFDKSKEPLARQLPWEVNQ